MTALILGVLLWSGVHLIPSVARPMRARLVESLDAQKYQGMFALAILASLGLIIFGWRNGGMPSWGTPPQRTSSRRTLERRSALK